MRLLALLLLALPAFANTCTLTGGTYATLAASATHWTGTGCTTTVPGSGDSATLAGAVSLTIAVGETWTIGTWPADHNGTPAIQASDTSVLTVNGTLIYQGPVIKSNSTWTINGGATVKCDSSGAATPATALYQWEVASGNNQTSANLAITGSAGAHVTWTSNNPASYACGIIGVDIIHWGGSGRVQAQYADFSYIGTASSSFPAFQFLASASPAGQQYTWDHCTFDHIGMFASDSWDGSEIWSFTHNRVTNPLAAETFQLILGTSAITTGTRAFESNYLQGQNDQINFIPTSGRTWGTLKNNVVDGQIQSLATETTEVSGNYFNYQVNSTIGHTLPSGCTTANNYPRLQASTQNHLDLLQINMAAGCNMSITGNVYSSQSNSTSSSDGSANIMGGTAAGTITFTNNIVLPTISAFQTFIGMFNALTGSPPSWTAAVNNNTFAGQSNGTSSWGVGGEGNVGATGEYSSIQHNISWSFASAVGSVVHPVQNGTTMQTAGTFGTPDNNLLWNIQKYAGTGGPYTVIGYDTSDVSMSGTPGVHDLVNTVNPTFADMSRSAETAFGAWLGMSPSRGAWALANSYAVGDTVSVVMPISGATTYWRAIATIGANTANSQPLLGSATLTLWEPAVDKVMGDAVVSGGANTPASLVTWVQGGFAPTNAAACGFGAVTCAPPSSNTLVCLFSKIKSLLSVLGACPIVY